MRAKQISKTVEMQAGAPKSLDAVISGEVTIKAAEGEKKTPTFEMIAYAGGPIRPNLTPPLPHPVVVDLAGLALKRQSIPVLKDHDAKKLVGHTTMMAQDGKQLTASGVVSGAGADATEVVMAAQNGFAWPVSISAGLSQIELIKPGERAKVNGRDVHGPVFIARASRPREISFLTIAADEDAVASIAAGAATGASMSFTEWLKANGFQPEDKLNDSQKVILQAAYNADGENAGELNADAKRYLEACLNNDSIKTATSAIAGKKGKKPVQMQASEGEGDTSIVELSAKLDRLERQAHVRALCGNDVELAATAVEKGWDDDTIKVAMKASKLEKLLTNSPNIRTGKAKDAPNDGVVLEAALAVGGHLPDVEKSFDEKALTEADKRFRRGIGLQEMILSAAHANGYTGPGVRQDLRGVMMAACGVGMQAQGFSTVSLPNIFANTANKFLNAGYMAVESAWRSIAAIGQASDFKTTTNIDFTGDATFEEVGPDGEIKHGTLSEGTYTNRVKTYGKMFAITRQDIINDDLNALTSIPKKLGRGAALKLNNVFWATWLADTTFFDTGGANNNYISGSTTTLTTVGLTAAVVKMARQTDPDGNPLALIPKILLVPPDLEPAANELYKSAQFNTGGSATTAQVASTNVWAGRYQPVSSVYLTNTTAWYLVADPSDLPAIEVKFLNGVQQPTVETADTDFDTLGTQMRGFWDFGVAFVNPRAAIKSKGAT